MYLNSLLSPEECRLQELQSLDILDSLPERSFDRITLLAKAVFQAPIALISLVDRDRQWFKSNQGMDVPQTPREHAFCHYAIQQEKPLVIPDATVDPRTKNNPLVLGEPHIRFYAGAPLITKNGFAVGTLCIIDQKPRTFEMDQELVLQTLASLVIEEMELRQLAGNDSLTGALTRRAFDEVATNAVLRSRTNQMPSSVLMIDLDYFKTINDTFGHSAGDALLVKTVQACRQAIRKTDPVGRRGGEEFCIFLENTDADGACLVAERIRAELEKLTLNDDMPEISLTGSFGVAEWLSSDTNLEQLLARADHALYQAKESGRNAVYVNNGQESRPYR